MFYDRKIRYIDYRKDGERIHGAGFIKIEVRNEICKMQIQISGLHETDTFQKQVYALAEEQEEVLCLIELQSGRGTALLQLSKDNLCNGMIYEDLQAIRIPISSGRELYCQVAERIPQKGHDLIVNEQVAIGIGQPEMVALEEEIEKSTNMETESKRDEVEEVHNEKCEVQENRKKSMLADKWEQLCAIYPHIQPFQDERDYLRIGPEDFVILDGRGYQLIHNSFLLHGYYNYQHLILTRQKWQGIMRYYIGVPGNYYEREKQVALMFGFESFECKAEPAATGEFGYYMIGVNL